MAASRACPWSFRGALGRPVQRLPGLETPELSFQPVNGYTAWVTGPPQEPTPAAEESTPGPSRRELVTALGLLYGSTLALLALSLAVPAVISLQQAILAGLLLTLPTFVLKRYAQPLTIDDLGVTLGPWPRTLKVAFATMALVFTLFAVGNHLYQVELFGARFVPQPGQLLRWGEDVERMPKGLCAKRADGNARIWFERGGVWVMGPSRQRLQVRLRTDQTASRAARAVRCASPRARPVTAQLIGPRDGGFEVPPGLGLWLPLVRVQKVEVEVRLDGKPVPDGRLLTGQYERSASSDEPLEAQLSLWWLLTYIIVHLGLVALPEEWFFRGYLQPRLDQRLGTRWRFLGVSFGPGLVLSAAAFALLHPILVPGFHRLAVFFPALLFGWLRAKTGNIGAAVIVHASANLLQQVLSRFYV